MPSLTLNFLDSDQNASQNTHRFLHTKDILHSPLIAFPFACLTTGFCTTTCLSTNLRTSSMSLTAISTNLQGSRRVKNTHIIGALTSNTAFHSFQSKGVIEKRVL